MLVAARYELKEEVGGVLFEGQVADFVNDDQPIAAQPGELAGQVPLPMRVGEPSDPVRRGGKQHPMPMPGGDDPECCRAATSGQCSHKDRSSVGASPRLWRAFALGRGWRFTRRVGGRCAGPAGRRGLPRLAYGRAARRIDRALRIRMMRISRRGFG